MFISGDWLLGDLRYKVNLFLVLIYYIHKENKIIDFLKYSVQDELSHSLRKKAAEKLLLFLFPNGSSVKKLWLGV